MSDLQRNRNTFLFTELVNEQTGALIARDDAMNAQGEAHIARQKAQQAELAQLVAQEEANRISSRASSLEQENARLQEENDFYKNLLSKPMAEIARENGDFRAAYEKQQELLKNWMQSQQAMKGVVKFLGDELELPFAVVNDLILQAEAVVKEINPNADKNVKGSEVANKIKINK
jgi:hypothetical protein